MSATTRLADTLLAPFAFVLGAILIFVVDGGLPWKGTR